MRRRLAVLLLAAGCLAAGGCGSSSSSDTASTPAAAPSTAAAGPASGTTVDVGMKGLEFSPKAVTVKVGQTVKWTNLGPIPHNVTAESGADFESGTFGQGGTYSYKATRPGVVKYVCTIHPGMEGAITVEG